MTAAAAVGFPLLLAAGLSLGCAAERVTEHIPPPPEPDTTAPTVRVLSPTPSGYDLDGDGFVDVSVTWSDSGGAVDYAHATLRSLGTVAVSGPDTANLLTRWKVERLDAAALVVHETEDHLLRRGITRLLLEVRDTAGNLRSDTLAAQVQSYVTLTKTIETGLPSWPPADEMALCDDGLLYLPVRNQLVIIDPDSLSLLTIAQPGTSIDTSPYELQQPLCVPGDPILYVADVRLMRFDRVARQWVPRIVQSYMSAPLALSTRDPDILYEGEDIDALVGIISRSQGTRIGSLLDPAPTATYINAIVPAPGDNPVYVAYDAFGGVWALDPLRDSVVTRINLASPGDTAYLGQAGDMAVNAEGTKLFVAVMDGSPRGLAEIDVATNTITRRLALAGSRAISLALSPDGRRAFVTTQDLVLGVASANALIDLTTWQPLEFVPRPRPAGQIRYDRGVVFRPDGKYIFVTHNQNVDVYLHRQ